jgi:phasin family protein
MITPLKPEQFHAANKAVIDTLLSVANTAFAAAENLAALNLTATRSQLEDGGRQAQAAMSARSPQELVALQSAQVQPNMTKAVAYSREVYQINAATAQKLFQLVQSQFSQINTDAQDLAQRFASASPFASEVALAAIQQAVTASNSTFTNLKKVAMETATLTDAGIKNTTQAALEATKELVKAAPKAPAKVAKAAAPAKAAVKKAAAPKKPAAKKPAKAPLITPMASKTKKK